MARRQGSKQRRRCRWLSYTNLIIQNSKSLNTQQELKEGKRERNVKTKELAGTSTPSPLLKIVTAPSTLSLLPVAWAVSPTLALFNSDSTANSFSSSRCLSGEPHPGALMYSLVYISTVNKASYRFLLASSSQFTKGRLTLTFPYFHAIKCSFLSQYYSSSIWGLWQHLLQQSKWV